MDRLKEPSTAAGLAALVALISPQLAGVVPELVAHLATIAGGLAGLIAIFKRERAR